MEEKLLELTKKYRLLESNYKAQEKELKKLGKEWEDCEKEILEAMVEEGVKSIKLPGIGLFSMKVTNFLSVTKENTAQFYEYVKASGNGKLFKEVIEDGTLKAFLAEHFENLKESIKGNTNNDDEVEARNQALEILKQKGVSYFTKRGLSVWKA